MGGGGAGQSLAARLMGNNTRRWALAAGSVAPVQRMRSLLQQSTSGTVRIDNPQTVSLFSRNSNSGAKRTPRNSSAAAAAAGVGGPGVGAAGSAGVVGGSEGAGTVAAAAAASAAAAAAVAAVEARQARIDSLTATIHHAAAAIIVILCWAVMAWFSLEYGTRVYEWIGASEEPHFLATFALALIVCLLYTSPSPRDATLSRMPSSA